MAYSAKSQKAYNEKCNRIVLKYTERENADYTRFANYIESLGIKPTPYIKELIKKDMDNKGIPYPQENKN